MNAKIHLCMGANIQTLGCGTFNAGVNLLRPAFSLAHWLGHRSGNDTSLERTSPELGLVLDDGLQVAECVH